jgi:hypothetical protein
MIALGGPDKCSSTSSATSGSTSNGWAQATELAGGLVLDYLDKKAAENEAKVAARKNQLAQEAAVEEARREERERAEAERQRQLLAALQPIRSDAAVAALHVTRGEYDSAIEAYVQAGSRLQIVEGLYPGASEVQAMRQELDAGIARSKNAAAAEYSLRVRQVLAPAQAEVDRAKTAAGEGKYNTALGALSDASRLVDAIAPPDAGLPELGALKETIAGESSRIRAACEAEGRLGVVATAEQCNGENAITEALTFPECSRLKEYRDGRLFTAWNRAIARPAILEDHLSLVRRARTDLVSAAGAAASDWSGAGASFASVVKLTSDLIVDLSGVSKAVNVAVAPVKAIADAIKQANDGDGAIGDFVLRNLNESLRKEIARWNPIAGGFANLANNSYKLAKTVDGWKQLQTEYANQLSRLDEELAASEVALREARSNISSLDEVKAAIDQEILRGCKLY